MQISMDCGCYFRSFELFAVNGLFLSAIGEITSLMFVLGFY